MKNPYKKGVLFGLFLAVVLAGCASPATEATPTNTPKATATFTPQPPTQTRTTTPPATRTLIPLKGIDGYVDIAPDEWTVFNEESTAVQIGYTYDIDIAEDGAVWMSASPGGLIKYQNGKWQQFKPNKDFSLHDITLTKENIIWVSIHNEIARFDGKTWEYYPVPLAGSKMEYLAIYWPPTITEDGKVWVSSDENIYSFDGKKWTVFKNVSGYLAESPKKELWVRGNEGLWRFNGDKWEATRYTDPLLHGDAWERSWLDFAEYGTMWFGSLYRYIRILPNLERKEYKLQGLSGSFTINDIAVSPNGDLWLVGFDEKIFHFTNEKWIKLTVADIAENFLSVAETPNGDVWIGGVSGKIYFYHPKH